MNFARKQWFLIALVGSLLLGFALCRPLAGPSESTTLKWSIVLVTMFLMAWPLAFDGIKDTLSRPAAPLFGSFINAVIMPLSIWPFLFLVSPDLAAGMAVVFAAPCTLASAAVWTRRAGGDDGVAIMVTIITNLLCFLVTPFWVFVQTGAQIESMQLGDSIVKLFLFVVLPIIVAQLIRVHKTSAAWATNNKPVLSIGAQIGILLIIFLGAIQTGIKFADNEGAVNFLELAVGVGILLLVHVAVLFLGKFSSHMIGFSREQEIAIAFAGSQKTLMVGLSIAISLQISILPIVAYHSLQLVIDTIFADRFAASADVATTGSSDKIKPDSETSA
jgi:sodium/bile acid cotransporter 7